MDGEQKPEQSQPAADPSAPPVIAQGNDSKPPAPATGEQLKLAEANIEKRMTTFERTTLRLTRAAIGVSIVVGAAIIVQAVLMYFGGADTHTLATAASNQAVWTRHLATNMQMQAEQTTTIAKQAIVQAHANEKLAQNAIDTLANTKQSFRDEQRAWVGVQGTSDIKGFTKTEASGITVVFFNSGRTPARKVQSSGMYITSPVPISGPSPQQVAMLVFRPAQSIAPQGYYRQNMGYAASGERTTNNQISGQQTLISQYAQINNRQLFLYYFGLLKYHDASGKPHETEFCVYLADPQTKAAGICDSFNDLN